MLASSVGWSLSREGTLSVRLLLELFLSTGARSNCSKYRCASRKSSNSPPQNPPPPYSEGVGRMLAEHGRAAQTPFPSCSEIYEVVKCPQRHFAGRAHHLRPVGATLA